MLMDIEIKEEPLEESEIYQQRQQETIFHHNDSKQQELWQKQLKMYLLKDNQTMSKSATDDQFHIVEEQEDVITVNAVDLKTQDELQFIEKLKNSQTSANQALTCPKCLKLYKNKTQLDIHMKRNNCLIKQKCSVCPLTFIDFQSLLNHLKLHRDNYFFCSQNCGASFRTLPLCEEHERNEHKSTNPPKIRYKHFCSFCREGFKTEVQLHVHWLQKQSACGQIMQKVVQHSNQTVNNNLNNNNISKPSKKINNDLLLNPKTNNTSNANSVFPLTKLRLKSNISPNKKDNKKRENVMLSPDNELTSVKRMKVVDDLKAKMTDSPDDMLLDFNNEIHIKEEPFDEDDLMNTTPPSLMPEVILKTEEEDEDEVEEEEEEAMESKVPESQFIHLNNETISPEMKSLLLNNNKSMNPDFKGKIIPLSSSSPAAVPPPLKFLTPNNSNNINNINNNNLNNNNINTFNINDNINSIGNNLKNITNLKLLRIAPGTINSADNRLPANLQIRTLLPGTDIKLLQTSKEMPLQLVKLVPSTQLLSFKTEAGNGIGATANNLQKPQPVLLQLQSIKPITAPKIGQSNVVPTAILAATTTPPSALSEGAVKINEMLANNTIDSEDFKKLQSEAFRKAEELRKKYISKKSLIAIDNLPEKKQLIANLKQQIAQVETPGDSSLVNKDNEVKTLTPSGVTPNALFKRAAAEGLTLNTKKTNEPPTIYLPVLSVVDVELVEARYQYPDYTYKWICPYCLKDYEIKRCLKSHLIKAHNLTNRDMEKINAQAKPFLNSEITPDPQIAVKQEPEEILSDSVTSESESMAFSQNSSEQQQTPNATSTDVKPIKMSALKMNKQRYVCNKCGRKCSSKTMLNDHMLANCSREPQYPCKQCPKKFYSESTLRCHVTIHTGELPHKCSYCDKRFRTRGQVTVHHRTHTGERPFVCQVCSQRFTHRETLIAHLSRHIGMKRYKCYCCDKHFSCISALKTHREIRPDTCGKVKFNPRAIGPRVRVVRGNVIFEAQPEINPYLKSEDPKTVLAELQNHTEEKVNEEIITS